MANKLEILLKNIPTLRQKKYYINNNSVYLFIYNNNKQ